MQIRPGRAVAIDSKILAVNVLFMRSRSLGFYMNLKVIPLLVICIVMISVTGCTTQSPAPADTSTTPALPAQTPPVTTISPVPVAECTRYTDCVPAECCHPSSCVKESARPSCAGIYCTMVCSGPLDCGAGSCGCVNGKCSVVPRSSARYAPAVRTGITIIASPEKYSPLMSSTPGVGLELIAEGFPPENATFTWKATYGQFLSWNSPDFKVNQLGDSTSNHGEKIYWSFIDRPSSTATPVTIRVTATDTASGLVLGSSAVTLVWNGDYTVTVKKD